MPDVKIYIACHKQMNLPKYDLFYPVQAGAALEKEYFSNMLHDDTEKHISEKNDSYCELTVQYWAWKNQTADYYGFFHYRRILSFNEKQAAHYKVYLKTFNDTILKKHGYTAHNVIPFVKQYDLLLPRGEITTETVYQKYAGAEHHYAEDLDCIMALISEKYPAYVPAMQQYLHGHTQYYYNMYVMKHALFQQYCSWLFPLLEQFDGCNNRAKYGTDKAALRVDGYLAERLFGIWFTYQKQNSDIHYCELPVLYFAMGNINDYCKQWLKNKLFPAGSKQRHIMKSLIRRKHKGM